MASSGTATEDKSFRREWQSGFKKHFERAYKIGQIATLTDVNLEEGDVLPDNASAEITESWIEVTKNGNRMARVKAFEQRIES